MTVKTATKKAKTKIDWREIKTFKKACEVAGYPQRLPELLDVPTEFRKRMLADYQLMIITKAINGAWVCDYSNHDQYKYWPYFGVNSSGSGFSRTGYDYWHAGTIVGSRLCFETREQALHSAKYFEAIHIEHQLK